MKKNFSLRILPLFFMLAFGMLTVSAEAATLSEAQAQLQALQSRLQSLVPATAPSTVPSIDLKTQMKVESAKTQVKFSVRFSNIKPYYAMLDLACPRGISGNFGGTGFGCAKKLSLGSRRSVVATFVNANKYNENVKATLSAYDKSWKFLSAKSITVFLTPNTVPFVRPEENDVVTEEPEQYIQQQELYSEPQPEPEIEAEYIAPEAEAEQAPFQMNPIEEDTEVSPEIPASPALSSAGNSQSPPAPVLGGSVTLTKGASPLVWKVGSVAGISWTSEQLAPAVVDLDLVSRGSLTEPLTQARLVAVLRHGLPLRASAVSPVKLTLAAVAPGDYWIRIKATRTSDKKVFTDALPVRVEARVSQVTAPVSQAIAPVSQVTVPVTEVTPASGTIELTLPRTGLSWKTQTPITRGYVVTWTSDNGSGAKLPVSNIKILLISRKSATEPLELATTVYQIRQMPLNTGATPKFNFPAIAKIPVPGDYWIEIVATKLNGTILRDAVPVHLETEVALGEVKTGIAGMLESIGSFAEWIKESLW